VVVLSALHSQLGLSPRNDLRKSPMDMQDVVVR